MRSARKRHKVAVATLAADISYDAGDFLVALELEREHVRPYVAARAGPIRSDDAFGDVRRRARDRQRNVSYARRLWHRKILVEFFGWSKVIGRLRIPRHVGRGRIRQRVELTAAGYNPVRMSRLLAA